MDDLLEVARITQGKIQLKTISLDMNEVSRSAIELSRETTRSPNHEPIVYWPESSIFMQADPERLTQIFTNLIDKAAKYTQPKCKIVISYKSSGELVTVSIQVNCVGIRKENLENILETLIKLILSKARAGVA